MDTNNEATSTYLDEDTPILPDGWADGDDLFTDSDDAAEVDTAAEPGATDTGVAENAADTDGLPTTESGEDAAQDAETDTETTDTTESGASQAEETMLRFKALVDHEDIDVELKESELPTIYQKARVTDRVQQRLAEMTPTVETAARLARQMGYDSPQDMLNAAAQNYHDSEIEKLTSEGVHPEVARDIVERRMQDAAVPVQRVESSEPPHRRRPRLSGTIRRKWRSSCRRGRSSGGKRFRMQCPEPRWRAISACCWRIWTMRRSRHKPKMNDSVRRMKFTNRTQLRLRVHRYGAFLAEGQQT